MTTETVLEIFSVGSIVSVVIIVFVYWLMKGRG